VLIQGRTPREAFFGQGIVDAMLFKAWVRSTDTIA